MATIVLGAVGAAVGASVGGGVLGLSSVVIGQAIGSAIGRSLDQRLLGGGSEVVDTPRVDRFRLTSAGEGTEITQVYGRMRVGGQVIWASRFKEKVSVTGGEGGKGAPQSPEIREYSYSVSLAIALCEGEITRVGRVWADGDEVAPDSLNMRVYRGTPDQQPDSVIEAIEGAGQAPAYRGTAYVVLEGLQLKPFGNRVPQFSFEVMRPGQGDAAVHSDLASAVTGVALVPGTGEYALATTPVSYNGGDGTFASANISTPAGKPDFSVSTKAMIEELPNLKSASLVVSWFGDDLRCNQCTVRPKVENTSFEAEENDWIVSGLTRQNARQIVQDNGRPVYGGTPTDESVKEAIHSMKDSGLAVMFYPFILMEQLAGNAFWRITGR